MVEHTLEKRGDPRAESLELGIEVKRQPLVG